VSVAGQYLHITEMWLHLSGNNWERSVNSRKHTCHCGDNSGLWKRI